MKKRIKCQLIAFSLIICSILNVSLTSIHADEVDNTTTENMETTNPTTEDMESYLGGGPSPSAAWKYNKSYTYKYTAKQLDKLSGQYQGNISSNSYTAGKWAYNISLVALGFMGKTVGPMSSAYISLFGSTYHSLIQSSANVLAKAASKNTSVTLRIKEYIRPASGSKMIVFY